MRTRPLVLLLPLLLAAAALPAQTVRRAPSITGNRAVAPAARPTATQQRQAAAQAAAAQAATSSTEVAKQLATAERGKGGRPKLKFDNAPAELFLQIYSQVTHRTLLTSPDVPKVTMSLRSTDEDNWSDAEYLQAIEQQLQLNGIGLIPVGERFVLVVPFKTIGQQGIKTFLELPEGGRHPEQGQLVRQILTPKNISAEEAQKAIEGFKRPDGTIQYLERTNSLLVTDTQENVNRMIEILEFIDKPMPVLEEVNVYAIKHAKAEDIKKALEEFVAASQETEQTTRRSVAAPRVGNSIGGGMRQGTSITRTLPGVTRPQPQAPLPAETADALVSDADRGMIRGKVQIMADERSNQLIIVTRPSNMEFFERIIKVLDVETAPEIAVEVIRLKYAQAETEDSDKGVADLLNELIDTSSSRNNDNNNNNNRNNYRGGNRNLTRQAQQVQNSLPSETKSRMGELKKENIKILADSRINAVMVMASPSDMAAIKEIIAAMDVPVAQVLIETVVLNVSLGDELSTGIQWVKRVGSGSRYRDSFGGGGIRPDDGASPGNLFDESTSESKTENDDDEGATETVTKTVRNIAENIGAISGGAQYYGTINKLNLDFLIRAASSDSRTKILTSPVLMTQDNKEATLENTELAYLYNGMKYMGYSGNYSSGYQPDISQEEIGLTITVTPRINPDGTVVLDFEETFQNLGNPQEVPGSGIDGSSSRWPSPVTRKISGSVAVDNGQTVVIGGLVRQTKTETESGIPILKDIPWIGKYLFGYTDYSDDRDELLVFLTPYVFKNSEEAQAEAKRRKDYLDAAGVWNKGWSNSSIADVMDEKEMLRREKLRRAYEDEQFEASRERIKARREHDRKMLDLLEDSIRIKSEELEDEREDLTPAEIKDREREIANERAMRRALVEEIATDEAAARAQPTETIQAAPAQAPAAPATPPSQKQPQEQPAPLLRPIAAEEALQESAR